MPGPFPGMDPFLEDPDLWPSVHNRLITYLADTLNGLLPRRYVASIEERVVLAEPPQNRYPDVHIVRQPRRKKQSPAPDATAVVLAADPPLEIEFTPEEIRETFVRIELAREPGTVVAIVEILSPTNKSAGDGRRQYLEKQQELLNSTTHLVEIDLLRAGQHTVAVPRGRLAEERFEYLVCLHQGGWQNKFHVWPIPLPDRLPRISIPLAGKDPDVVVDLQPLLEQCYDLGRYEQRLDYRKNCPPPPLPKENAKWMRQLLREKKLRK